MPRLSRRDIDEHVFDIEDPPEVIITCEECGGEGAIDEWESASKWSIDPPCARLRPCPACGGQGTIVSLHHDRRRGRCRLMDRRRAIPKTVGAPS